MFASHTSHRQNKAQFLIHLFIYYEQHVPRLGLYPQSIYEVTGKTLSFVLVPKQERVMKQALAASYRAQQFVIHTTWQSLMD